MSTCFSPTLDDLLADPLVQALMSADRVDAGSLRREMTRTAARVAQPNGHDLAGARVRFAGAPRPARAALPLVADKASCESRMCC
jgi:hypothetical protein